MQDILFIINPVSAKKLKQAIEKYIEFSPIPNNQSYQVQYSEYSGHAYEIAKNELNNYKAIVAVGGDGTVNQVSKALVGSNTKLGIIPLGSGNGLANFLNIPRKIELALEVIHEKHFRKIDSCVINNHHFVNMAGIGFDAYIAHEFEHSKKRGFKSYFKSTLKAIFTYKAKYYTIQYENEKIQKKALLISFANSNQYGNDAFISPLAKIDDGEVDVCVLKKFPFYSAPFLALRLFANSIHKSKYLEIYRKENITIHNSQVIPGHVDGEPVTFNKNLDIEVIPKAIEVITPSEI